jgi:hypothetical protein
VAVVAEAAADHKVGADEAAVRVIDNHRSVFIHRLILFQIHMVIDNRFMSVIDYPTPETCVPSEF